MKTIHIVFRDFSRFKYRKTKYKYKKYFYTNCLQVFSSLDVLKNHQKVHLEINGKQSIKIPEKHSSITFTGCVCYIFDSLFYISKREQL